MIRSESASHTHEPQDSECHDKMKNELRNTNGWMAEQKIKTSNTNLIGSDSSSLDDSFDMLKDISNGQYVDNAEDHTTTLPSVTLRGGIKRDSTPIHKNIREGSRNQTLMIKDSKAEGQSKNSDDGSTITCDSNQILPGMVNSLVTVGNDSIAEQPKSSGIAKDKHSILKASNSTDQGSSLSLRPSMISSSVIGNDYNDSSDGINCENSEKRISLDNLGDTICSSVHESCSLQDQAQTAHEKIRDSSSANLSSVDRHEFHSFLTVGHHLFSSSMCMDESSDQTPVDEASRVSNKIDTKNERNDWWEDFSDNDWDTMKEAAQFIIDEREQIRETADPSNKSSKTNLPIIPPSPPSGYLASHCRSTDSLSTIASSESQNDSSSLLLHSIFNPREFICPLCKDIIVGAAILDCTCAMNTFCSLCLEENFLHDTDDQSHDQNRNKKKCPSCNTHVTRSVPCHTLDVAILNAVKDINTNIVKETSQRNASSIKHEDIVNFQHRFYKRLLAWRNNVLNRHKVASLERERQQEVLLSLLIQKEEELFWKIKQEVNPTDDDCSKVEEDVVPEESSDRNLQIHRTRMVDVAMVAAAAFVGMSLLRRN